MNDKSLKILLIEDNAGDVRLIREMLAEVESMSYNLEPAGRLSAGLECLTKQQFDVVLLDLGLPDSQGLETLNKIYTQTPKTPIVVLTGLGDEAIANQAVREGAQDYLLKGDINGRALWRVIRYAIERKQTGEVLRKSEQKYRLLADNARDIIWTIDMNLQFTYMSPSVLHVRGYTVEEVMTQSLAEVFTPSSLEIALKALAEELALESMEPKDLSRVRTLELEHICKDGSTVWVEINASFLRGTDGQPIGILGVSRDITERKRVEEALHKEKQFAESLIDTAQAIILVLDIKGRIVSFNRYMEEVSGYHLEEVQGKDWFSKFLPEYDQHGIKELFLKAIAGIQTIGNVSGIVTKDGRTRDIEWYDKPLKDENGDTVGLLAIGQDVTEHRKLEKALAESEQWYRHIFDNALFGIGFASIDGKVINLNKAMEVITGYSAEEFSKINLADTYVNKADRETLLQEIRRHGSVVDYPLRLRRKDGTPYDAILSVRLTSIGDREFVETLCHDVTERKKTEESLRLSEQNFRDSIENSPLGIRIINEDGKTLYANRALLAIHGYSSLKELAAVSNKQRYTPQGYVEHKERVKKRKLGEYVPPSYEISIVRKDGQVRHLAASRGEVLWDGERQFQVVYEDITEHKQAEEALLEAKEFSESLITSARDGISILDNSGVHIDVNPTLCEMTGFLREELIGVGPPHPYWPPERYEEIDRAFQMTIAGDFADVELTFMRKNGEHFPVIVSPSCIKDQQGNVISYFATVKDITERKQAEKALLASESKYRSLFEESIDPVFITTREGIVVDANQSMLNLCGYTMKELIGIDARKLYFDAEARPKFQQKIEQRGFVKDWEMKLRKKDGTGIECLLTSVVRRGDDKNILGYQGIIRDISERKLLEAERNDIEEKAELASRLASIGEMASGIAHEINNPLTAVIGYAQLLSKKELPEDVKEGLEVINDGAQRVAVIIKRLLTFARQYKPERTLVNINNIIETTLSLRSYHLKTNNIKLTTRLAPDLPATVADAGQLQQVFLNLIVNAETEMKQAHGKGKLSVITEQMDNIIRISFKDDGPGILKKNMERIFNPFFTTRKVGEGTGLGLSVCHGIIAEHGGRIYAESRLGRGATFIVELPIITADKQMELPELIAEEPQKVTNARILVVDDEPGVRQFLEQALTEEGHEVETVDNASDALERIKSQRYNLILLDIKMPDMSGIEFYERIHKISQSLAGRVVFITGDVLGINTAAFLSKTKAPHIVKPFDTEQLKKDISRILTEGARGWARRHGKAQV